MMTTQTIERESLFQRILGLPEERVKLVAQYVENLEAHEPNEETRAAILEGDELARAYCSRFAQK